MVVLGGGGVSYERGTPVQGNVHAARGGCGPESAGLERVLPPLYPNPAPCTLHGSPESRKPKPESAGLERVLALTPSTLLLFFITLVAGPRRSLSLTLSDTRVYEPQIRARLGTTAHFCEVVVLKLRAVPV